MMKRTMSFLALLLMMVTASTVFTSCTPDEKESTLTVDGSSSTSVSFSERGESNTVWVQSNTSWRVSGKVSGIEVFPSEGNGSTEVTIIASQNTSKSPRQGGIRFLTNDGDASAYVNIYQEGSGSVSDNSDVSGSYVGTLKPIGFSDSPARAYVTLTRLSSDAVRLSCLICEEFGMDMNPVNLKVRKGSDGSYTLTSETNKSIQGTYYGGQLTLTFSNSLASFYFTGYKD